MTASKDVRQEQGGVALRMAAALCVTVFVVAACLYQGSAHPAPLPQRMIVVAKADVFVLCWLAAAIGNVARLRFFSADDIAGSGSGIATGKVRRARAILQNTLEQVVLAVPIHVALAVLVAASVPLIVALAALFAIGRHLFWMGYARGAEARAFGFALTFYPSLAGLIVAICAAVKLLL